MKSIMHNKEDGTCYLCMMLHDDYSRKMVREEHHTPFGCGVRRLAEKYGLKVYLCIPHHKYGAGKEAVHQNDAIRRLLDKEAQKAFERHYPNLDFRQIFGKNLLDNADRQQSCKETEEIPGMILLDDPIIDGIDW